VTAVLVMFREIEQGRRPTVRGTGRGVRGRFALMARALARPWGTVFLLAITIVGLPWAIARAVRWGFVAHAVLLDEVEPGDAAARSAEAVHGHWWRTAGTDATLTILGSAPGPILGTAILYRRRQGRALPPAARADFVTEPGAEQLRPAEP
jgi:hypothetical protein